VKKLPEVLGKVGLVASLAHISGSTARIMKNALAEEQRREEELRSLCALLGKSREEILEAFVAFPGDWHDFKHLLVAAANKQVDV